MNGVESLLRRAFAAVLPLPAWGNAPPPPAWGNAPPPRAAHGCDHGRVMAESIVNVRLADWPAVQELIQAAVRVVEDRRALGAGRVSTSADSVTALSAALQMLFAQRTG